uniref:Scavenger receptor class B member 1 n=1 Tax=Petromyzon marinus TaxID=7757 RepID=A0AAJ7SKY7_PETMA|nr:scavenger receptor class B member 1-like [Petromyzon marinus]
MFIDLHPLTGVPVNVSIRLQLNMMVKGVEGISTSGTIKPVILPILWFEESGHMDGELRDAFWTNVVLLPLIMDVVRYGLLGLGLALVLTGAVALAVTRRHRETDDDDDDEEEDDEKGDKGEKEAVTTTPTKKKKKMMKWRFNNNNNSSSSKKYREVSGSTAPPPEKITKL